MVAALVRQFSGTVLTGRSLQLLEEPKSTPPRSSISYIDRSHPPSVEAIRQLFEARLRGTIETPTADLRSNPCYRELFEVIKFPEDACRLVLEYAPFTVLKVKNPSLEEEKRNIEEEKRNIEGFNPRASITKILHASSLLGNLCLDDTGEEPEYRQNLCRFLSDKSLDKAIALGKEGSSKDKLLKFREIVIARVAQKSPRGFFIVIQQKHATQASASQEEAHETFCFLKAAISHANSGAVDFLLRNFKFTQKELKQALQHAQRCSLSAEDAAGDRSIIASLLT